MNLLSVNSEPLILFALPKIPDVFASEGEISSHLSVMVFLKHFSRLAASAFPKIDRKQVWGGSTSLVIGEDREIAAQKILLRSDLRPFNLDPVESWQDMLLHQGFSRLVLAHPDPSQQEDDHFSVPSQSMIGPVVTRIDECGHFILIQGNPLYLPLLENGERDFRNAGIPEFYSPLAGETERDPSSRSRSPEVKSNSVAVDYAEGAEEAGRKIAPLGRGRKRFTPDVRAPYRQRQLHVR